jgi:2,5-diamino-6-(ribosylamino)-4(3H)-pyrimidinone 5'-phosphate reductase
MNKPITTLFLNISLDGKISTGDLDTMDTCLNYPKIKGIGEGYLQYYKIEETTDLHTLNSAKVLVKSHNGKCINEKFEIKKTPINFMVIDNKPHLNAQGVENLLKKSKVFYLITSNKNHPAFSFLNAENLRILYYNNGIDFKDMFTQFKEKYKIEKITVQTGGTLNSIFLRNELIDKVSIVVVPALVGGRDTSTLIDGESLHSIDELTKIKALKLDKVEILECSYLHLKYDVINQTEFI